MAKENPKRFKVDYTVPTSRQDINSGDELSVIVGKIAKIQDDLKTVAYSGKYSDLSGKPTIDTALSSSSTNAVQNKIINSALSGKASTGHNHDTSYLKLTGGTLNTSSFYGVNIKRTDTNGSAISYQNSNGSIGGIGFLSSGELAISSGDTTNGNILKASTTEAKFPKKVTAETFSGVLSGNAATATKWQTARNINGLSINGENDRVNYGKCSTAAGTVAKIVDCEGFTLITGAEITVKFTITNTATAPTLNVNGTGNKPIYYRGSAISPSYIAANRTYTFRYNGTQYDLVGDIDTNTTYSNFVKSGSGAKSGLVPAPSTTAGNTKYLREDGTWQIPPNNTYSNMTGASSSTNGKAGLVPAPTSGKQTSFLRGDGTWVIPTDTKYTHPTTAGNKHIPTGGTSGQCLKWKSDGTAEWAYLSYLPSSGGTLSGTLNFSNANSMITWNNGTYQQRIKTTDDSNVNTAVFSFQQSSNSGETFADLMTIKDNGQIVANSFVGSLSGNASSATKLTTARKLNGISFDGTVDRRIPLPTTWIIMGDSNEFASKPWFKIASASTNKTHEDVEATFFVKNTWGYSSGILQVRCRIEETAGVFGSTKTLHWLLADDTVNTDNFVLICIENSTTGIATIEVWCKARIAYDSYAFVLLDESNRSPGKNVDNWTLYDSSTHSATYTSGTYTITSTIRTIKNPPSLIDASTISSGTLNVARLATSGVTAASYGPSANVSPTHSGTFSVPNITVDKYGRVTAASTKTITLPTSPYLPLTGGTLTIDTFYGLNLKRTDTYGAAIAYKNSTGDLGGMGFSGAGDFIVSSESNTNGNILKASTTNAIFPNKVTAETFDGAINVDRVAKSCNSLPNVNQAIIEEYNKGTNYNLPSDAVYHIMSIKGQNTNYGTQLALGMTSIGAYYRNYNNSTWGAWKSLINTDTDKKVNQTATTSNANYEVLLSYTADNTTREEGARKSNQLTFNPSTKTLTVTNLNGNATSATKVYGTLNNTTGTYYIPFYSDTTNGNKSLGQNDGLTLAVMNGTTSTIGYNRLELGNNKASGTAGNKRALLKLYGQNNAAVTLSLLEITSNVSQILPQADGVVTISNLLYGGDHDADISDEGTAASVTLYGLLVKYFDTLLIELSFNTYTCYVRGTINKNGGIGVSGGVVGYGASYGSPNKDCHLSAVMVVTEWNGDNNCDVTVTSSTSAINGSTSGVSRESQTTDYCKIKKVWGQKMSNDT